MKPWYKSKTVWVGLFEMIAAIADLAIGWLSSFEGMPDAMAWVLLFSGIAKIILRWTTSEPITSLAEPLDTLRPKTMSKVEASKNNW